MIIKMNCIFNEIGHQQVRDLRNALQKNQVILSICHTITYSRFQTDTHRTRLQS